MPYKEFCKRGHKLEDTRTKDGNGGARRCGECRRLRQRLAWPKRIARQPTAVTYDLYGRSGHLWRTYNLTLEQYDLLFQAQNGVCAICQNSETATNQHGILNLSVDHDHVTGRVRGLLCRACNSALGRLGDNITMLERALKYLQVGPNIEF